MLFGDSWPALHGAVTHFPVALLLTATFFDLCAVAFKKPNLRQTSLYLLALAVVACIPTIITGRLTAGTLYPAGTTPPSIVSTHALLAYVTSGLALFLLICRLAAKDKLSGAAYAATLLLSAVIAAIVGYTGHLGGEMVFGASSSTDAISSLQTQATQSVDPKTAAIILKGAGLYASNGCTSCHSMNGTGAHSGPDLTHEGSRQPDIKWQIKHLMNPTALNPNSTMPPYSSLDEGQLTDFATFLVSKK